MKTNICRIVRIMALCGLAIILATSTVLATTGTDISQFDIIDASSYSSEWTTRGCTDDDDIEDGCYVRVTADSDLQDEISRLRSATPGDSYEEIWRDLFNNELCDNLNNRDSYYELNRDFNDCWEDGTSKGEATVRWPKVSTGSEYFEASGFCQASDAQCAISISICYNADECDGRSSTNDDFDSDRGRIADFFDDNDSCLYDVSRSRFTECINDGLRVVYNALNASGRTSFSDLEQELEERGVEIDGYDRSLSRVRDRTYFDGYTYPTYPEPVYRPVDPRPVITLPPVQGTGHRYPAPYSDFLVVNFTKHLEAQPHASVCGTNLGCIQIVGQSNFFTSYMGNLSIVIRDQSTLNCMRNRGVGGRQAVDFDNPDLRVCSRQIANANNYCPAKGLGAQAELLKMWNLGLIPNLLSSTAAVSMQNSLADASRTAPNCLCRAGFRNGDLLSTTSLSDNPWEAGTATAPVYICTN